MSEHSINHIGDMVKKILEILGDFVNQIMEALNHLKKLPDYVAQLRQDMNEGFDRLIQAQGEMEIYIRMARLKSKKQLIKAENEAIQEFEEQLQEDFSVIDKRYSKINHELDEECKKRIRQLDMHLLEIPSKFPNEYISAFNEKILPIFEKLINDSEIAYNQRVIALEMAVEKSRAMINRFVKVRNEFFEKVANYEVPQKIQEEKEFFLPVWYIEIENKENMERKSYLIPPSEMTINNAESYMDLSSAIMVDNSFQELKEAVKSQENQLMVNEAFSWKVDTNMSSRLADDMDKYFQSKLKGNFSLAKKMYLKAIRKSAIQVIK